MRINHIEHDKGFVGEHGVLKGIVESGFRHPLQHHRPNVPAPTTEMVAWLLMALPFFGTATIGAIFWDRFAWQIGGTFWGLFWMLPVAFFASVTWCALVPIASRCVVTIISNARGR
jgi:hypothetical protein